ncbi:MAG: hypothetical protein HWQ38_00355 [Nostoc sp. NMS7]|uniref:hypothetical protein n=1 Tax=Nostoc sp. NMS7 TaxID=2815391 RepID=UPI0025E11A9E|nr:hypothetical protein [Nostoc sp. NMS7]MBN3945013.1 hypothetical protein [Nostoc sp. NMS7]
MHLRQASAADAVSTSSLYTQFHERCPIASTQRKFSRLGNAESAPSLQADIKTISVMPY